MIHHPMIVPSCAFFPLTLEEEAELRKEEKGATSYGKGVLWRCSKGETPRFLIDCCYFTRWFSDPDPLVVCRAQSLGGDDAPPYFFFLVIIPKSMFFVG